MRLSPQGWTKVDCRAVKLREGKKGKKRKNSLGLKLFIGYQALFLISTLLIFIKFDEIELFPTSKINDSTF